MAKDKKTKGQATSQISPESEKVDAPLSLSDMQQQFG